MQARDINRRLIVNARQKSDCEQQICQTTAAAMAKSCRSVHGLLELESKRKKTALVTMLVQRRRRRVASCRRSIEAPTNARLAAVERAMFASARATAIFSMVTRTQFDFSPIWVTKKTTVEWVLTIADQRAEQLAEPPCSTTSNINMMRMEIEVASCDLATVGSSSKHRGIKQLPIDSLARLFALSNRPLDNNTRRRRSKLCGRVARARK